MPKKFAANCVCNVCIRGKLISKVYYGLWGRNLSKNASADQSLFSYCKYRCGKRKFDHKKTVKLTDVSWDKNQRKPICNINSVIQKTLSQCCQTLNSSTRLYGLFGVVLYGYVFGYGFFFWLWLCVFLWRLSHH